MDIFLSAWHPCFCLPFWHTINFPAISIVPIWKLLTIFLMPLFSSELITDVHAELYSFYVSSHFSLVPRRWEVWDSGITSPQNPVSRLISLSSLPQRYIETPSTLGETPRISSCTSSYILSSTAATSSTLCPLPISSILIQTTYNRLDPGNRKMPTPQEREADLVWTEEQRRYAEHAVKMDSVDQLVSHVSTDSVHLF